MPLELILKMSMRILISMYEYIYILLELKTNDLSHYPSRHINFDSYFRQLISLHDLLIDLKN